MEVGSAKVLVLRCSYTYRKTNNRFIKRRTAGILFGYNVLTGNMDERSIHCHCILKL